MLQLLDDGRVTDSKGNVVNFCNCIVIFTSNVGSQSILDVSSSQDSGARKVRFSLLLEGSLCEFSEFNGLLHFDHEDVNARYTINRKKRQLCAHKPVPNIHHSSPSITRPRQWSKYLTLDRNLSFEHEVILSTRIELSDLIFNI